MFRIRVVGDSMAPALNDGDWLLFRRARCRVGSIVLIQRDSRDFMQIKRVTEIYPNGDIWVEGDNKEASTDSRSWGALQKHQVKAVMLVRYRKGQS